MKITSTREIHVTLTEAEANGIVNALSAVLNKLRVDGITELDRQDLLLKLKTELVNAPR